MKPFIFSLAFVFSFCSLIAQDSDFYNTDKVRVLEIEFAADNWEQKLDSLRFNGNGRLPAQLKIDGKVYPNVGVRYRGGKSFLVGQKRNALNIKLDAIVDDQNHQGVRNIKLSQALRDPSMIREVLGFQIARNFMHAPKANFAKIVINGDNRGIYANIESVDEQFLKNHFGTDDAPFYKSKSDYDEGEDLPAGCKKGTFGALEYDVDIACYPFNFEDKNKTGYKALQNLTSKLNKGTEDVRSVLDIDQVLWMLAYNNVIVNLSSYTGKTAQNFYLYQNKEGKFVPIVWDLNLAFGSYKNIDGGSSLKLKELQKLDPLVHVDNITKPLIQKLLSDRELKKVYIAHMKSILETYIYNKEYLSLAKKYQALINTEMFNCRYDYYLHSEFLNSLDKTIGKRSKIPGIEELMAKRAKYMRKNDLFKVVAPKVTAIDFEKKYKYAPEDLDTFKLFIKTENFPKRVFIHYRLSENEPFKSTFTFDNGQGIDKNSGDNVFSIAIPAKNKTSVLEYYITLENTAAIGFHPSNYVHEPLQLTLKAINTIE